MRSLPAILSGLVLAVATALAVARYSGTTPRPTDAPANAFSAMRALHRLRVVLGDERPHPLGSPNHEEVRTRLLGELRRLGYQPEVESAFTCNEDGECATVSNVFVPSDRPDSATVLLSAHYDSQVATPGAADDGAGVAVLLEVARAVADDTETRAKVAFLFTDGEELGLLGAQAFAAAHAGLVRGTTLLNFEARGASGPALMFETGRNSAGLVRLFARQCPRPISTSLFTAIYESMPNDTDFSVFKQAGMQGLNFAFIGDLVHYHSPTDTLLHLDAASLQHAGDCALALVHSLARSPAIPTGNETLVFAPLLDERLLLWSDSTGRTAAVVTSLAIAAALVVLLRRRVLSWRSWLEGLVIFPVSLLGAAVTAQLLRAALVAASGATAPWTAHPVAARAAFWASAAAANLGVVLASGRRAGFWGLWAGAWSWMSIAALDLAWTSPAAGFAALLPLAATALGVWISGVLLRPKSAALRVLAVSPAIVVAAFVLAPLALAGEDAMTLTAAGPIGVCIALLVAPLAPILSESPRRSATAIAAALGAVGGMTALYVMTSTPWTPERPRALNLMYHVDAAGEARWIADTSDGPAPQAVRLAAGLRPNVDVPLIFGLQPPLLETGPAPTNPAPPPELEVIAEEAAPQGRLLRLRLSSPRRATAIGLALSSQTRIQGLSLNGVEVPPVRGGSGRIPRGWKVYTITDPPPEGVVAELRLSDDDPVEAFAWDRTNELPPFAGSLLRARPSNAVPKHVGDTWVITRRYRL